MAAPLLERLVKAVEGKRAFHRLEVLLHLEVGLELAVQLQELVESADVLLSHVEGELLVVGLLREVLINFLAAKVEEPPQFFVVRPAFKQLLVLQLRAILGVAAHQELAQEDAGVEALANRRVDHRRVVLNAFDFFAEFLERRHQHWVQFLGQVNVIMFFAVGQVDDLALQLQQGLHERNIKVFREEIHVVLVVFAFLGAHVVGVFKLQR